MVFGSVLDFIGSTKTVDIRPDMKIGRTRLDRQRGKLLAEEQIRRESNAKLNILPELVHSAIDWTV